MASQHIYPNTSTRLGAELNGLVSQLKNISNDLPGLKAIMDQIASGGDWAALATEFGYSTAADAETAYNLIASLTTGFAASSFITQVTTRMG